MRLRMDMDLGLGLFSDMQYGVCSTFIWDLFQARFIRSGCFGLTFMLLRMILAALFLILMH